MSPFFNMLSRFVIAFLPGSKHLLILWLQSPSSDFGAQENKICYCLHFFSIYLPWSGGTRCHDVCFLSFKTAFSLSFFTFIKRFFSSSLLSAIRVVSSAYLRLLILFSAALIPACILGVNRYVVEGCLRNIYGKTLEFLVSKRLGWF